MEPILLRARNVAGSRSIQTYRRLGGYSALEKALASDPGTVCEEVKRSGLRGRGGAGFPTGTKWGFVPPDTPGPRYLICNADESEPGTFKDRELIRTDPHMIIEGIIIASYAIQAHTAYVYIRGEFVEEARILEKAVAEAYSAGFLGRDILKSGFHLDLRIVRGAGAYICGEETALIESVEGKRGNPRLKPPFFPAAIGLFRQPTVVNNVETLACVPHIIERGASWFAAIGVPPRSSGPKRFSVSGHVERPGVYELPLGVTFRELIEEHCGGVRGGRKLKAFIPGGSSTPILPASAVETPATFDDLAEAGSALGSGGVIVMDETVDMVWVAKNLLEFYVHESCGKCVPCRLGGRAMLNLLHRLLCGEGTPRDLENLERLGEHVARSSFCGLGQVAPNPVLSTLRHFRHEYEAYVGETRRAAG